MTTRLHLHDTPEPRDPAPAEAVEVPATWEATLADLEDNVTRVEDAVRAEERSEDVLDLDASWVPPADLGPLPEHLRERATMLLGRQLAVAEELVHEITWSKKQRDVAAKMAYAKTRPAGAFFDNRL